MKDEKRKGKKKGKKEKRKKKKQKAKSKKQKGKKKSSPGSPPARCSCHRHRRRSCLSVGLAAGAASRARTLRYTTLPPHPLSHSPAGPHMTHAPAIHSIAVSCRVAPWVLHAGCVCEAVRPPLHSFTHPRRCNQCKSHTEARLQPMQCSAVQRGGGRKSQSICYSI